LRRPSQLRKLFNLRFVEGVRDKETLARTLGVTKPVVWVYFHRLYRRLNATAPLVRGENDGVEEIIEKNVEFICPECLNARVWDDPETGERTCASCGYVLDRVPKVIHTLPFGETYALVNPLAFNKSLGETLPRQSLYTVLAKVHGDSAGEGRHIREEAPIPIHQIRAIHDLHEPPLLRSMKEHGERLRREAGLDQPNPICDPDLFSVALGNMIEKVGNVALFDPDFAHRPLDLAVACFHRAVRRMNSRAVVQGPSPKEDASRFVKLALKRRREK
jgi:hypothetical protein